MLVSEGAGLVGLTSLKFGLVGFGIFEVLFWGVSRVSKNNNGAAILSWRAWTQQPCEGRGVKKTGQTVFNVFLGPPRHR